MENLNGFDELDKNPKPKLTTHGKIILGFCGAAFVGIYAITGPFLTPALRKICLPYVPATPKQIDNVFSALSRRRGSLLDIGSGDGRIVIEASKRGYQAGGVELNVWLVLYSKFQAWKQKQTNVKFYRKDLWKMQLSGYENIVVFGVEKMMERREIHSGIYTPEIPQQMEPMSLSVHNEALFATYTTQMVPLERKFASELSSGCHVVACRFPLQNWEPVKIVGKGVDTVWLYRVGTSTDKGTHAHKHTEPGTAHR